MKIAMLSPIAWRTPPNHYGPWERITSLITEGLVKKGIDVTLFATKDSMTAGKLNAVCPRGYEESKDIDPKVWECLHIANCFEQADQFDIIHNHFDFLPLTYTPFVKTPVVSTIHGFSSPKILEVYKKYNYKNHYVSISHANRSKHLKYVKNIYHGIDIENFTFNENPDGNYLLYFGRIHPDKGTLEAIEIALNSNKQLIIAGIIQDQSYFEEHVLSHIDDEQIKYIGSVGPIERNKLLQNAIALLHPINFEEPFGLSIIESMACGTPVIAFDKGSMSELIKHGETGFITKKVDETIQLIDKIPTIDRKKCRKWVENNFSQMRMVNDYIELYEQILSKK